MNYRIAPQARQDLSDIWQFIAQDNLAAADRVIDTIKDHFRRIALRKDIGRSREELAPGLRSLVVRPYRRYLVFYRSLPEVVEILRVLHSLRNLKRMFKRR